MIRAAVIAASLGLCLAGVGTVTEGVAVPVKARVAQRDLEQVFEQRLAANTATPLAKRETVGATHRAISPAPRRLAPLPVNGPVARITVQRLGVKDVVLAGEATHDQLAMGPTLIKHGDAASPVTVLAAHRDTHFLFIRDLQAGDAVTVQWVNGQVERYRVVRFETVRWDQFAYPIDPARPLLALTTCFPFGGTEYGGPLRRVAWAERIA